MKKFLALLLALVMVFALAACGSEASDPNADPAATDDGASATPEATPEPTENPYAEMSTEELLAQLETVTDGVLSVATSPDFAPYEFYALDENGNATLAGFDIALAQYLADFMGLECQITAMDFDGIATELSMKTTDIGLAGFSPDPEREGAMAFSDLYYLGGQSFVTTKDKADLFPDLESINNPEYQIGCQSGSIQQDLAEEYAALESVTTLVRVTDIVAELVSGGLDGAFIETAVAENYSVTNPDLEIVLEVPYDQAGSAVGVQLDNPVLLELVNRGIAQCIESGEMDRFVAEANELSLGDMYEGLLDASGQVPDAGTSAEDANAANSAAPEESPAA